MKNSALGTTKAVKIDVLVLENLFYSAKYTQVFDLKGSERNRLINTQGKNQEKELVLLDENFLRYSFDNPFYIKYHAKYVLMKAIESDTEFLSDKFVMDYSLLCGLDPVNNQIIVGIIDYIRTFTWDKKIETALKTIGGSGRMPTIVSPENYRTRFISAIERYFLEVPDHWYHNPKE
jgi:1-phosphatidylinositol-3-phosphate 5-kinase